MKKCKTEIQPRFADFDILGHVNNVNLQHYFDVGKDDYFTQVMGVRDYWHGSEGVITAATNTSFLAQIRPTERVYVESQVEQIGTKSIKMYQRIISHGTEELKAESHSVMVAFNFKHQESIAVPDVWRKAMIDGGIVE